MLNSMCLDGRVQYSHLLLHASRRANKVDLASNSSQIRRTTRFDSKQPRAGMSSETVQLEVALSSQPDCDQLNSLGRVVEFCMLRNTQTGKGWIEHRLGSIGKEPHWQQSDLTMFVRILGRLNSSF